MKATGIIRRIDDLGRVVIPKEIRRTLRIREGDPLEIFLKEDGVVFKKYSALGDLSNAAEIAAHMIRKYGMVGAIYDRDEKLNGPKNFPQNPQGWNERNTTEYTLDSTRYIVNPILSEGDIYGFVVLPKQSNTDEAATAILRYLASMLET